VEISLNTQVLVWAFVVAVAFGAIVNRTDFCAMGAVSDWVNIGDRGRMGAWLLALAVALLGAVLMERWDWVDLDRTRPPYRSPNFAWPRYLLGGLMFGIGMTLAGGCASKNLVRLGSGNLKSLVVIATIAVFAYLMTRTGFYAFVFYSWIQPISIDLASLGAPGQDLGSLVATVLDGDVETLRTGIGAAIAILMIMVVARSRDFWFSRGNAVGGVVVGGCVLAAWYITGGPLGVANLEALEWLDQRPDGVGVQSLSFVNPMADAFVYLGDPDNPLLITFGMATAMGVLVGSCLYAVVTRNFRIEWFTSVADLSRHLTGGALMGIGGILGLGCTIGQGVSGTSTLALGSFLTLAAIILGSATTMKVQYYKMLYEDASFAAALLSGLADLHLLPQSMRRLESL
jgi:hypothetical protein